jgi:hypothetical protein
VVQEGAPRASEVVVSRLAAVFEPDFSRFSLRRGLPVLMLALFVFVVLNVVDKEQYFLTVVFAVTNPRPPLYTSGTCPRTPGRGSASIDG